MGRLDEMWPNDWAGSECLRGGCVCDFQEESSISCARNSAIPNKRKACWVSGRAEEHSLNSVSFFLVDLAQKRVGSWRKVALELIGNQNHLQTLIL